MFVVDFIMVPFGKCSQSREGSKSVFNIAPCSCLFGQNLTKYYLQSRVLYQNKEFAMINIHICLKKESYFILNLTFVSV